MTAALLVAALAVLCLPNRTAHSRLGSSPTGKVSGRPALLSLVAAALGVLTVVAVTTAPTVAIALATIGATVAHRLRRNRNDRRRENETRALLAGLEVAVADLRAGAHPEAACLAAAAESGGTDAGKPGGTAADEPGGTAAVAFRSAAATARLGGSAASGLLTAATPGNAVAADLDRIAGAWRIAERHGIALAELLDAARTDLTGRRRFRSRAEAGMAGARATAGVLAVLPVLGIALGQMMGAAPLRILTSGGLGGILLVIGTALACAGLAWSDHITRKVTT